MANILAGNNGVALGVASLPDQLLCPADKRKAVRDYQPPEASAASAAAMAVAVEVRECEQQID
jgi:hypothetical protein